MKIQQQCDIVIEIEQIQVIPKRAKKPLLRCIECRETVDFVSLHKVDEFFEFDSSGRGRIYRTQRLPL